MLNNIQFLRKTRFCINVWHGNILHSASQKIAHDLTLIISPNQNLRNPNEKIYLKEIEWEKEKRTVTVPSHPAFF